jgi:hypothetical protein
MVRRFFLCFLIGTTTSLIFPNDRNIIQERELAASAFPGACSGVSELKNIKSLRVEDSPSACCGELQFISGQKSIFLKLINLAPFGQEEKQRYRLNF